MTCSPPSFESKPTFMPVKKKNYILVLKYIFYLKKDFFKRRMEMILDQEQMFERKNMEILHPAGWAPSRGYANGVAVDAGWMVFIAGQVGWMPSSISEVLIWFRNLNRL